MTDQQEKILKGTIGMYNGIGEMLPTKLFNKSDIDRLVESNDIKVLDDPYGIGDDFFGVVGKPYPIGFDNLCSFRNVRENLGGNAEMTRNACVDITTIL